ncbi:MAG: hypothetical protein IT438_09210 [Phycisphaerales bacterium]|nr:hypothetical protein [Phycisphaerales bacterium]
MEQLRKVWQRIAEQLGRLTPSQKLLIGSLMVVLLMSLFLVSQYAGAPSMVPIAPGATPEDQQKIADALDARGVEFKTVNGNVVVPSERQYALLAQLQQASALPADKKLLFPNLFDGQSWMRSKSELDQRFILALGNELAAVARHFPGVSRASVNIDRPEARGIGRSASKPTATITVFTKPGSSLDPKTVSALADLVAGSVSGLDTGDVKIVDGTNGRSHRASATGDFYASSYLEHAAKVEERVQTKIVEHLAPFIPNVIVSVNAIVDASRKESKTDSVLPKGEGTQAIVARESTTTTSSNESAGAAEPGPGSNVGMDLNRTGGSGRSTNTSETQETENEILPGRKTVMQIDPQGKPLKINVSVSVPKNYVTSILSQKSGAAPDPAGGEPAAPSDADVEKAWDAERARLEAMLRPLIDTEAAGVSAGGASGGASAGSLVVSLIPVALATQATGATGAGAAGFGGGLGGLSGVLGNGLVKQIALGGLAAAALGLMLLMVRKAGKPVVLPTAEELVGVPPALEPHSDLVGEAEETDTAMQGIEIDDSELKTTKMLEQVGELVKSNPGTAANVFSKWLTPEN